MSPAPALFVSHGSPMFAVEPGLLGPRLGDLGRRLPHVAAVVVVSPHWQTQGLRVMTSPAPETVHDFGGFPAELFRLRYDAPGAPDAAMAAMQLLREAGFEPQPDVMQGRDHGCWVPLLHLLPEADIPVFQVSLPQDADAGVALRLGRALAPLRAQGVLVVGSGSMTHNLYEFRRAIDDAEYAQAFADWVREAVLRRDIEALVDYRRRAPQAERAHPTEEHFLPLLVAVGAAGDDPPQWIEGGMTHRVLSMDSFIWEAASA